MGALRGAEWLLSEGAGSFGVSGLGLQGLGFVSLGFVGLGFQFTGFAGIRPAPNSASIPNPEDPLAFLNTKPALSPQPSAFNPKALYPKP